MNLSLTSFPSSNIGSSNTDVIDSTMLASSQYRTSSKQTTRSQSDVRQALKDNAVDSLLQTLKLYGVQQDSIARTSRFNLEYKHLRPSRLTNIFKPTSDKALVTSQLTGIPHSTGLHEMAMAAFESQYIVTIGTFDLEFDLLNECFSMEVYLQQQLLREWELWYVLRFYPDYQQHYSVILLHQQRKFPLIKFTETSTIKQFQLIDYVILSQPQLEEHFLDFVDWDLNCLVQVPLLDIVDRGQN
ncbi:hypothetical protein Tco_1420830 [Tanacetum coccineum]